MATSSFSKTFVITSLEELNSIIEAMNTHIEIPMDKNITSPERLKEAELKLLEIFKKKAWCKIMANLLFKVTREQFGKVVDKFILRHDIRAIIDGTAIEEEDLSWKCHFDLRGGFSINIELVEETLYKDDEPYCDLQGLFGKDYEKFIARLNFLEAMKEVYNGKKVKTQYFKDGVYIYFDRVQSEKSPDNSGVMVNNNGDKYQYVIKEKDLFTDFYIVK